MSLFSSNLLSLRYKQVKFAYIKHHLYYAQKCWEFFIFSKLEYAVPFGSGLHSDIQILYVPISHKKTLCLPFFFFFFKILVEVFQGAEIIN